jgi:hypothetical protein
MGDINVNGISHELRTYEVVADFRDIGSERKVSKPTYQASRSRWRPRSPTLV